MTYTEGHGHKLNSTNVGVDPDEKCYRNPSSRSEDETWGKTDEQVVYLLIMCSFLRCVQRAHKGPTFLEVFVFYFV
jgi:hypothetical protein